MTSKMLIINEPGWLVQGSSLYYSLYFCNMFEIFNNKKLDISMHYKSTCMYFIKIHLRCVFFFFFKNLFFNWRKITFQCCVGFRHTKQISHNYTYITCLLSLPPLPSFYPSRSSQGAWQCSLCYIATSLPPLAIYFTL